MDFGEMDDGGMNRDIRFHCGNIHCYYAAWCKFAYLIIPGLAFGGLYESGLTCCAACELSCGARVTYAVVV